MSSNDSPRPSNWKRLKGDWPPTKRPTQQTRTGHGGCIASRSRFGRVRTLRCQGRKRRLGDPPFGRRMGDAPEIAEGATVHKDQVLLLMPDLSKMQVKVGIHESIIDRMKPGLSAKVTLPDKTLDGTVSAVASVTRPAGWWTGNEVRYDTIIQLAFELTGLRPGMSAEVEMLIARYEDVLTIPVAAVVETEQGDFCWVKTAREPSDVSSTR